MKTLLLLFLLSIGGPAAAAPGSVQAGPVVVHVKGMVCSFCVQGVEKLVSGIDGVEDVEVDLDKGTVTIIHAPGVAIGDVAIQDAIRSAGYNIEKIVRQEEAPEPSPPAGTPGMEKEE